MNVLYETTNSAKVETISHYVQGLGIEIIGLKDVNRPISLIVESGKSPFENAKLKAKAYYDAFKMTVFSCDSGLFFENIAESFQPGTHVRRINGQELNDEEMI